MRAPFAFFLITTWACVLPARAGVDPTDAAEIIDTLLELDHPRFRSGNDQRRGYDALAAYKSWNALYEKYAQLRQENEAFREDYLRVYLLLGRIALETTDAATMESFDTDLMSIYERHGEQVLQALKDLPFLIPSTCRYLSRYFGFEGRNRREKPGFLSSNEASIRRILAPDDATRCLRVLAE